MRSDFVEFVGGIESIFVYFFKRCIALKMELNIPKSSRINELDTEKNKMLSLSFYGPVFRSFHFPNEVINAIITFFAT